MTDCPGWLFKKHDFDKWEVVGEGEVHSQQLFSSENNLVGFWMKQKRVCKNCGYTQLKLEKVKG